MYGKLSIHAMIRQEKGKELEKRVDEYTIISYWDKRKVFLKNERKGPTEH